jgi:hypothetical protein
MKGGLACQGLDGKSYSSRVGCVCVERERKRERERKKERKHTGTMQTYSENVCVSILECLAARHFDRCGTCAAQLCLEEEGGLGERGTSLNCKKR